MILDPNGIARVLGVGASGSTKKRPAMPTASSQSSADRTAMLLFRVGKNGNMAVPLGLVSRLEDIKADQIEVAGSLLLTQYRGKLMPLIPIDPVAANDSKQPFGSARHLSTSTAIAGSCPVLVFIDRGRSVGLIVDEIIDVVEEQLQIEMTADRPGMLGIAVIAGRATDVIDTAHWLTRAHKDWFATRPAPSGRQKQLLVVEDDQFFRQMVIPVLAAADYAVTAAADGEHALRLREAGARFDAIISDIDMPTMDGIEFARRVRTGGIWTNVPLIALTGLDAQDCGQKARDAGFTDHVLKHDRVALLSALQRHFSVLAAA
jgi:two-component system chemotaxis sensor kinase CheA